MLYLVPGVSQLLLRDASLPIMITEGEFKTLALWRLANHGSPARPRFLPLGVSGVYNWRGTIGKTVGPDGSRLDVKGAIPDLDWVAWEGRRVVIAYDADAVTSRTRASWMAFCWTCPKPAWMCSPPNRRLLALLAFISTCRMATWKLRPRPGGLGQSERADRRSLPDLRKGIDRTEGLVAGRATAAGADPDETVPHCKLTDLSLGGCYVETDAPFPERALVDLCLKTERWKCIPRAWCVWRIRDMAWEWSSLRALPSSASKSAT